MRILVIYCHPVPESFGAAVRDTVLKALADGGNETRLIDLYAEKFDPVMGCDERRLYNDMKSHHHPLPDHAAHLAWAEGLMFVYPTWWYGLPAMLKGWLDRVWTPEITFAISPDTKRITPLMKHIRKVGIVTTCGAPRWWSYVVGHPGKRTILRGMRALFATRCRTLFLAHYLMDVSTPQSRADFLAKVDKRVRRF